MSQLIDQNLTGAGFVQIFDGNMASQSFTCTSNVSSLGLTSVVLSCGKIGSPTGTVVVDLCTHTGTYGTSSLLGTVLATSLPVDISSLSTGQADQTFQFPAAAFALTFGAYYVLRARPSYTFADASNVFRWFGTNVNPHSGNTAIYFSSSWTLYSDWDLVFTVYGAPVQIIYLKSNFQTKGMSNSMSNI